MKPRVRQVIVVEGRYDKNALLQVVDAVIVETGGFSVFHDREKLAYLRRLAAARGVILMTDPDGAGFVIRNHLKGVLPPEQILQAYVPNVYGKERRKRKGGKEGKLGVEGMPPAVLLEARADVCSGISRANTAIVYPGYDNEPGSLKAEMTVRAGAGFGALCDELGVRFSRCGSLMVSYGPKADGVLRRKGAGA